MLSLDPHRIVAIPGVTLDVVVAGATGVASPPSSALQQIGQQAAQLPRYNPLSTLQSQWSTTSHFTTSNNTHRTLDQNRAPTPHTSRGQLNNAATRAQKRGLELSKVKAIIRDIAVCIDLDALHAKGDGRPQDFWRALECYLKRVQKGQTQALISVGDLFLEGGIVQQNPTIAMSWYLKAAYLGDNNARHKIDELRLDLPRLLSSPQEPLTEGLKDAQQDEQGNNDTIGSSSLEAITILANTSALYSNQHNSSVPPLGVLSAPISPDPELTIMMKKAKLGVLVAQERVGDMYLEGRVIPKDAQAAIDCYLAACNGGCTAITRKLGPVCLSDGVETAEYFTAIDRYHQAVVLGNLSSQRNLGNLYFAAKDYTQAMAWYMKAAEEDAAAYYNIGYLYDGGHGVPQDYAKAMIWYRKAADQADAHAQINIGYLYQNGYGVSQDYAETLIWFRKAAGQGNAIAQNNIGELYYYGHGVSQDYAEAMIWYRKAADQGVSSAQHNIGELYYYGHGVSQDYVEAMRWYRKAADQGDSKTQYNIGHLYHHGHGVSQDYAEAMRWYRKAVDQGNANAQNSIGCLYQYGHGVSQDSAEAMRWYRKAADQGYANAQTNIGELYYYGHGVSQDYAEAMIWYQKAADQGNASAQHIIGYLYQYGHGASQDYAKAMIWYRKAADQGDANAQCSIGVMYNDGLGMPKDKSKALGWYKKAALQGDSDAKDAVKELEKQGYNDNEL
ncbi:hypothetical protein EC991_008164 [Linnemannia zychae]|nr:hypothetical protein EC991_008164 [Linnemannia zychae]